MSNNGVRISRTSWGIDFTTRNYDYCMYIYWTSVNNVNPEEVGMQGISLFKNNDDGGPREFLAELYYQNPSSE